MTVLHRTLIAIALAFAGTAAAQDASSGRAIAVEFVAVEERPLTTELQLTGTLAARDSIELSFPSGGRIADVMVEAGDQVRAGQALARTDGVQQKQALNRAEAAVAAAEAAERQARQAADRADEMLRRGVGTRAASDAAQQALSAAEGQLESARNTAAQSRRANEDTVLRAPQDAVVTSRLGEPGQVVGAAQPILSLAAMTGLEGVFQVPDAALLDRAMSATVEMAPLDFPHQRFSGQVSEIAPLVDPRTGAVTIKVTVDAPLESSLLGAAVVGWLKLPAGEGISLPWTALTVSGDSPAVWKIGPDSTVSAVPVELDRYNTGSFVVKSGLAPGDTVVGEGSQLMYPGRPVTSGKPRS